MWKVAVGVLLIVGGIAFSGYKYFTGEENKLYEQAKQLEAEGKIYEAHDTIVKALELNPTNRKVIAYKSQLFAIVDSDTKLKNAVSYRNDAVRAMDRGDYVDAAEKLDKANTLVYEIFPSSPVYKKAEELQAQILKDTERLKRELPERYYNRAKELANNGEYERAYNALLYIKQPSSKIIELMDQLAYQIGNDKMAEIERDSNPTAFLIRDAISWYNQISSNSPNKVDAKIKAANLNKKLQEVEKKNE